MRATLPRQNADDIFRRHGNGRLAGSVAVALALHLLLFGLIRTPGEPALRNASPLFLQWRPLASSRAEDASGSNVEAPLPSTRGDSGSPEYSRQTGAEAAAALPAAGAGSERPAIPAAEWADSARRMARQWVQEQESPRAPSMPLAERPVLPALARALRKEAPGETRLANGIVKITTAFGASYCLRTPPDFTRGGPLAPLAVPTTCP